MNTVLIVGAGGSLAEAIFHRPRRTGDHPPLDATFFRCARSVAGRHQTVTTALQQFRSALATSAQLPDPFTHEPDSLEQYFADIYYEVAATRSSPEFSAYVALVRLYSRVLGATTGWMAGRQRLGHLGQLISKEVNRPENDLTVITFNHDLVIENIAHSLAGSPHQWCLTSLYNDLSLDPLLSPGTRVFSHHDDECQHKPPFRLLKLHGSLNWVLRTRDRSPAASALFPRHDKPVFLRNSRTTAGGEGVRGAGTGGRQWWYLWPLIVPPIYDKSRITGMAVLESMWDAARSAIRTAHRIVLVGYSLPEADVAAMQMIRRGIAANGALREVDCVNPDPRIAVRLKSKLNCPVVHLYDDIASYQAQSP
jgi:hypothetical protein